MREIWLLLDSRGLGGIESHVAELAEGLADAGEAPRVMFLHDHGPHPLAARLRAGNIPVDVAGGPAKLLGRLRRARPRVLHSHGYKANLIGRAAAALARVPHVASYHAGERPAGRVAIYDAADRWTSFLSRRIAVSRPIQAKLPFGGTLIPNFVAAAGPAADGLSRRIGFAGRLAPEKAPDRFATLARLLPGAAFDMFGDGPMRPEIARDRPANLTLHGAVAGMAPHWHTLGLLVLPSRAEGLPLAALEAMAHGVPVAAFALGGLPELITDGVNGYLAPPDDLFALRTRIEIFLTLAPPARRALADAARATVAQRFGRAAGVTAVRALYPAHAAAS